MRTSPDIDNEESLFQFDPYDGQSVTSPTNIGSRTASTVALPKPMASVDRSLRPGESDIGNDEPIPDNMGKGNDKSPTLPMPIRATIEVHDIFDLSPPSVTSMPNYSPFESLPMTFSPMSSSSDFDRRFRHRALSIDSMEDMQSPESDISSVPELLSSKGKERESVPMLPPLTFSMMQLDCAEFISSAPGPSSYGALSSPATTTVNLPTSTPSSIRENSTADTPQFPPSGIVSSTDHSHPVPNSHVSRSRSLTNLSQELSPLQGTVSIADIPQALFRPTASPSNLSRQLLDKKDINNETHLNFNGNDIIDNFAGPSTVKPDLSRLGTDLRTYPSAWYTVSKPLALSPTVAVHSVSAPHLASFNTLKGGARSKSSPYPGSILDYVPVTSSDIFQPLPIIIVNYFDLVLPKELRLRILAALVELHEQDLVRSIQGGRFTMAKATSSKGRWLGRDKGVRELFKLSRVSKAWQDLVFDGELWTNLDMHSFPGLPPSALTRLTKEAGSFIRSLNFAGHIQLPPDAMSDITNNLCLTVPDAPLSFTQLTSVNFQGCTHLTTRSIHYLLVRSKSLEILSLKGLVTATNTTCDIIANFLPNLISLNLSRCPNIDGQGISSLTAATVKRKERMPMKELRLSGLKYITDSMMRSLGRAMPYLEVLDLSYARELHNSAIEAFVVCDTLKDESYALETVVVSARDLGREANESGKFKRRVTKLRHLALSSCFLLTDTACSNLAYSVPNLEFLELAGIGQDLKDDGLIRLLSTTPHIRRLDLEDATEITDSLISELTPVPSSTPEACANNVKHPGHALEYLNISYATNISDDALLYLIKNCPRLTVLEADNTQMGPDVLREFIKLSRERNISNAKIVAIDCRGISESLVKELSPQTRPRLGWRAYGARKLMYLDARDNNEDDLKIGQDECDEKRVVLKTFYSWQTVNAVQAAKEKRRKLSSRRALSESVGDVGNEQDGTMLGRPARWWSPGGRRATGGSIGRGRTSPPILPDLTNDGCRAM